MRDGYYLRYASLNFKPARRVAGIIKPQQSAKFRNRVFRAQIAEFADAANNPQSRAHLNVASGGSIEPSFYCWYSIRVLRLSLTLQFCSSLAFSFRTSTSSPQMPAATTTETDQLRRSARRRNEISNYYRDNDYGPLDRDDPQNVQYHLRELRAESTRRGFDNLFDAVLTAAQCDEEEFQDDTRDFIQTGGLTTMYEISQAHRSKAGIPEDSALRRQVCAASQDIYLDEWARISREPSFRKPLGKFSSEYIESFSFTAIYATLLQLAPCLFALLVAMTTRTTPKPPKPGERVRKVYVDQQWRQRVVVFAIAILANLKNQKFNVVQGFTSFYLYASHTPKRVMAVLNHLGVCVSYSSLKIALSANGEACAARLRSVCKPGLAFFVSYDNLTKAVRVRDDRIHNHGGFITSVAGFVYVPPPDFSQPMFTPEDCDYRRFMELNPSHFGPTESDQKILQSAFASMIWEAVRSFLQGKNIKVPEINFPMKFIHPIEQSELPEIPTLPMYNLDEAKLDDAVQIHYSIQEDIGMTPEQVIGNIVPFRGDNLTCQQNRFVILWLPDILEGLCFGSLSVRQIVDSVTLTRPVVGFIYRYRCLFYCTGPI